MSTVYTIRSTDWALLRFTGAAWEETGATIQSDFQEHGLVSENSELFLWGWRAGGMQMYRWDGAAFVLVASLPGAPRPCGAPADLNGTLIWPATTRRPTPDTCVVWDGRALKTGAVPLAAASPAPESLTANFMLHLVGECPRVTPLGGVQHPDGSIVFWGQLGPIDIALGQGQLLASGAMAVHRFGLINPADGAAVLASRRAIDSLVVCSFEHEGKALTLGLDWTLRDAAGATVWVCPAEARAVTVGRRATDHPVDWLGARPLEMPDVRIIGVDAAGEVVAADATGTVVELPDSFTLLTGLGGDLGARPAAEAAVRPCALLVDVHTRKAQVVLGGAHRSTTALNAGASTPTYRLTAPAGAWEVHPIELCHGRPDHAMMQASLDMDAARLHVAALNRATRLWHHYAVEASGAVLDLTTVYQQGQEPRRGSNGLVVHREGGTALYVEVVGAQPGQISVAIRAVGAAGVLSVGLTVSVGSETRGTASAQVPCSAGGTVTVVPVQARIAPGEHYHMACVGSRQ